MRDHTSVEFARSIMGRNFIGKKELETIDPPLFLITENIPEIPFSKEGMIAHKDDYMLILGQSDFINGQPVTIRNFRVIYGVDPNIKEPCFYNQDWYENEIFIDQKMENKWYFIRKAVYADSRAVQPFDLLKKYTFPSAIDCTYAFFVAWLSLGVKLWKEDFIWCRDTDHNGDRIYVGRYYDADKVNKNGFNVHRHLALRSCYGCID